MNPTDPNTVTGVVTDAWPYVIAGYGITWVTMVGYAARIVIADRKSAPPDADRTSIASIAVGTAIIVLGALAALIDYRFGLQIPKYVLYLWATPGVIAAMIGIVRTL